MDSRLLDAAQQRVLVLDGAMGTSLQARDLTLDDYAGCENCSDVLVFTRPDVVQDVHRSFLEVGCDAVLTNTFGANRVVLAEFGRADEAHSMNQRAATLAREVADAFTTPAQPRFVLGSMGPGTKLPTLGQVDWPTLHAGYLEQARGLLAGGVDALLVETCQDILQAKAAVVACIDALAAVGRAVPIFCTVTIETTGTMLVGTEMPAALVAISAYPEVCGFGLNCATGPQEMSSHVRYLAQRNDRLLIVQPNAGLPQMVDGQTHYPLTPAELGRWLRTFIEEDGVNIVGGCCGTTPAHLAAVVEAVRTATPRRRTPQLEPSVSSTYQAVTLQQDTDCLAIGERTNANGSKRFRELLADEDLDGMVKLARDQVKSGSHLLDVCAAYVGRDEVRDMQRVVQRFATDVTTPLVIDSTEPPVLEAALQRLGGKSVINSINLEAGEERLDHVCRLARRYGAAVIALTIDEEGMAKTAERKIEVARRIYERVTQEHGIAPTDLIFDPLTFTICTGQLEDRRLAVETLDALPRIKEACPGAFTLLGVSNVSFGVKPPLRKLLNSVFLHHARQQGLDAAIVHVSGIVPLHKVPDEQRQLLEDLIYARQREDYDPLTILLRQLTDAGPDAATAAAMPAACVEDRLKQRIIDGDRTGLDADLDEALQTHEPLAIINDILLAGMKTVGELFGAGEMQLPFVLQSAETMKAAVAHLEPHMDRSTDRGDRGSIVLATVAGDVHDIGKNLVDILLTNNGFTVHNLGIKQPIEAIIDAWQTHQADAIGMSGLLVKSTLVMRDNLRTMQDRGLSVPVLLGGAALTRSYVEQDLRREYAGRVDYAPDAFAGLHLMRELVTGKAEGLGGGTAIAKAAAPSVPEVDTEAPAPAAAAPRPCVACAEPTSDIARDEPVPEPPFWGSRVIEHVEPKAALAYLNEKMLFKVQWQYRPKGLSKAETERYLAEHARPALRELLATCTREGILHPQAVYGYWPVQSDGDRLLVFDPDDRGRQLVAFDFPRMAKPPHWCISDFFRSVESNTHDVAAFSIVTVGRQATETARAWFAADRYQDYLHLHGLSVELAEALAEYVHKQIRVELGIADADARDLQELFKQGYQGSRYSFGYPACPNLADQEKLWPLLQPERIGVSLTEGYQLDPEQSTTALIVHHRQAKYFNVAPPRNP